MSETMTIEKLIHDHLIRSMDYGQGGEEGDDERFAKMEASRVALVAAFDAQAAIIADLLEATEKAVQLALVASDWNLSEVDINGEMVSIYRLRDEFSGAIMRAHGKPPLS